MAYVFYASCLDWPPDELDDLQRLIDEGIRVSADTFYKRVGRANYRWLTAKLGYANTSHGGRLTLRNDYYVAFFKAPFRSHTCYYAVHSAIEYVFVPSEAIHHS